MLVAQVNARAANQNPLGLPPALRAAVEGAAQLQSSTEKSATTSLIRVRLEAARSLSFPEGSTSHGYEFVVPLNKDGRVNPPAWEDLKDKCRVFRFWGDRPVEEGLLRHGNCGWWFDYENSDHTDDEAFFTLDKHALSPGAYVPLPGPSGVQHPFRVLLMVPWGEPRVRGEQRSP